MNSVQDRLNAISGHLAESTTSLSPELERVLSEKPEDIVITCAIRTPLTKARRGGLKNTSVDDLLVSILKSVKDVSKIDPAKVEDVCVGNVLRPGAAYVARSAVLAAGYPVTTASSVTNRFCSSGLLAIQNIAGSLLTNAIEVGIAVGCESMSSNPDDGAPTMSSQLETHSNAKDNLMPMGWTSENVAAQFNISRSAQDQFAALSHQKAGAAQKAGWFSSEIVPVETQWVNPKTNKLENITVDQDDGIRYGTTAETLGKIRPAFPDWDPSTTTGGNASQLTDGAAAVLLMKRSTAEKLGQKILGKFVKSTVVGLEPRIMGVGPVFAIPKILEKTGLRQADIDIFEINEAFASMSVYCVEKLKLDISKVNPRGGAIALGHPLGCTGVRQVVTALSELRRRRAKVALTSMCVGTGMGMAAIFVLEN